MRPICVDHMTLPVGDLERSVAFYRAALVEGMGWVEIEVEGLPHDGAPGPRANYSPSRHGPFPARLGRAQRRGRLARAGRGHLAARRQAHVKDSRR